MERCSTNLHTYKNKKISINKDTDIDRLIEKCVDRQRDNHTTRHKEKFNRTIKFDKNDV